MRRPSTGLLENARRARLGLSVADYRRRMGELFAPFTKVAAKNPFASSPVERGVDELITVTASNRMICDPYPRLLVARDQVNQGAAVLLMPVAAARRLGVPEERWVFLHGHADMVDQPLLDRLDLTYNSASVLAVHEALAGAGIGIDDGSTLDLYSCFPVPVFNFCDGTGLATDDPRGLTSPAACRTSADRATTTRCTASPRRSAKCGTGQANSAWSPPTAGS